MHNDDILELKAKILKKITEEKETILLYKGLCEKYHIEKNQIPEKIANAKVETMQAFIKDLELILKK